jgi:hypothetical protein
MCFEHIINLFANLFTSFITLFINLDVHRCNNLAPRLIIAHSFIIISDIGVLILLPISDEVIGIEGGIFLCLHHHLVLGGDLGGCVFEHAPVDAGEVPSCARD